MNQLATDPSALPAPGRELFVRHALKDGRSVAFVRAIDYGTQCIVEATVYPPGETAPTTPGPYTFADAREATAFVTELLEALTFLGCQITAAA